MSEAVAPCATHSRSMHIIFWFKKALNLTETLIGLPVVATKQNRNQIIRLTIEGSVTIRNKINLTT